jgi:tetratricopeptide (TPR) repeat protein
LWADRYDLDLADVVAVQREITDDIAHVVGLDGPGGSPAPPSPPARRVDPEAYDLYLRAQTRLERVNATDADSAVAELERAVSLDPEFADAFGALASAYAQLYGSYEPARASGLEPRLRAAIDTALALDPDSPDALLARGALFWNRAHGWQHEEAIETQRRAVALRPTFSAARRQLSVKYNHVGLAQAALDVLVETEESPAVLFQKGLAYRIQGRLELALASWLAIPEGSRNTNHVGHIAWALIDLGRTDEAARMLRGVPPGTVDVNGMLSAAEALLHATAGEVEQAQASIAAATSRAVDTQESHHATYLVAVAYARLGDNVEALRWLRFTAANGFPCHPLFESDPDLDPLRSYEPFVQFVEESRSRWEGYRTRLGMETSSTAPARPAPPGPAARPS